MRAAPSVLALALLAGCAAERAPRPLPDGDPGVAVHEARLAADPEASVLQYNLGTALLGAGRHEEARAHLERAAQAGEATVAQAASYNLGNVDLEPAFAAGAGEGREGLVRAIAAYKRALLLDPGDADAKWNLELARRLLREAAQSPSQSPEPQGGGGGGGDEPESGRQDPRPRPAGGGAALPPLSPAAAERLLAQAQRREVGLQREALRKQQPRTTSAH